MVGDVDDCVAAIPPLRDTQQLSDGANKSFT